jgi:hypothetical protein
MKPLAILLLIISFNANAWDKTDTAIEAAYTAVHIIDWGQTLDIASKCNTTGHYETNPILGRCPSNNKVNLYFASTLILHYAAAYVLPVKYRRMFQSGTIGMELSYTVSNANIGLNVNF